MATTKALLLEQYGAPFKWVEMARPQATEGEALVRIRASGVNPLDTKIRAGQAAHARHRLPAILGLDLAGVVEVRTDRTAKNARQARRGDLIMAITMTRTTQ